jgi:RNA polymerase sigma-70 factor (ECF subfamily)
MVEAIPTLHRFALSLTRDRAEADELLSATVLRSIERLDRFEGRSSVRTWMRTTMYRLSVDEFRRARRDVLLGDEVVAERVERDWMDDDYTVDGATVVERAETRAELEDALARLPATHRTVVLLHDVDGLTAAEIAELMDSGLPATKQRLRRGRMQLVSALAEGVERRAAIGNVPLRCWDARRLVSDYLDDELEPASRRAVEAHLEGCPTCPHLVASLVSSHAALGALRDPDSVVDPEVAERLRQVIAGQSPLADSPTGDATRPPGDRS